MMMINSELIGDDVKGLDGFSESPPEEGATMNMFRVPCQRHYILECKLFVTHDSQPSNFYHSSCGPGILSKGSNYIEKYGNIAFLKAQSFAPIFFVFVWLISLDKRDDCWNHGRVLYFS